ncbi:transcriptional corepressor leunig protein [Medicago truncatula]|uniref:Transcriptional corepressor leunig protein n=1 Tax=Medicago truncatula TaxID=3880 RepID=A0A072UNU1_MEDTR|nr:transcriptional corepressor leunig protein [Medicago truncatula]
MDINALNILLHDTRVRSVASHLSTIFDVRFKPGSTIFATSSADKTVKLWDAKKPARMFFIFRHSGIVRSLDFHPTEQFLCSSYSHDGIQVWDLNRCIKIKNCKGHVKYICSLCWDVTGQMIASVSADGVRVWTLSMDGQCLYEYPSKGKMFMSVIFHPRYRNVLVVGGFQCMEFFILECNGQIRSIPSSCISITGLAACTRKELFASTSNNYAPVVNIWK